MVAIRNAMWIIGMTVQSLPTSNFANELYMIRGTLLRILGGAFSPLLKIPLVCLPSFAILPTTMSYPNLLQLPSGQYISLQQFQHAN